MREDIKEMLELSGAKKNVELTFKMMMDGMGEYKDEIGKFINVNSLMDMTEKIYSKHFDSNDIKDMIEYYKTPLGKKMLQKLPIIMQESIEEGQKIGEKAVAEMIREDSLV